MKFFSDHFNVRRRKKENSFASARVPQGSRGFTLIEMIVSTALFAVVMLVSVTALLSLVDANRKTQALHSVMNNLNIALDSMVRALRMGSVYHCGGGEYSLARDCGNGDTVLAFEAFGGDRGDAGDQWVYLYDVSTKRIYKSENSGQNSIAITSPSVTIDSMKFYVIGTTPGDTSQPKVVISIKGTAGADKVKTRTTFHIQATAVQRALDL